MDCLGKEEEVPAQFVKKKSLKSSLLSPKIPFPGLGIKRLEFKPFETLRPFLTPLLRSGGSDELTNDLVITRCHIYGNLVHFKVGHV